MLRHVGMSIALVLGMAAFAPSSQAAPGNLAGAVEAGRSNTAVEKAAYRRCWWRNGVRHCRWVRGDDDGYYGYGPYGYGPGINLYFGGGGHRGHGGHHGGHHR